MDYLNRNTIKNDNTLGFPMEDVFGIEYNKYTTSSDIQSIIECISLSTDTKSLMKLYSVLASCLITYPFLRESVVKSYVLYEKINYILNFGQPLKTATALNFLIILAYNEDDEDLSVEQSASQYARNMIRVSGCLKIILQYFTSHNMMHADTWKAVCQCIVECCRGCDINQAHCSYLIPICINKCKKGDNLMLHVLHALLQDNKRNCEYFVDSNGLDIFTRPLLCETICVQLLAALVQEEPRASKLLQSSSVPEQLIALAQAQGKFTKIGQWCKVILYYIYGDLKVLDEVKDVPKNEKLLDKMKIIDEHETIPESKFLDENNLNSTSKLLNNMMREILNWNKENNSIVDERRSHKRPDYCENMKSAASNYFPNDMAQKLPEKNPPVEGGLQENSNRCSPVNNTERFKGKRESRSSFINNNSLRGQEIPHLYVRNRNKNYNTTDIKGRSDKECQTTVEKFTPHFTFADETDSYKIFNPVKTSTPKSKTHNRSTLAMNTEFAENGKTGHNKINIGEYGHVHKHNIALHRAAGARRPRRRDRRSALEKAARGRSVSARIFGALNDTCSTVVNAIKHMIMPRRKCNTSEVGAARCIRKTSGDLSFANYMKRRDVARRSVGTEENDNSLDNVTAEDRNSICISTVDVTRTENVCKTCNDTLLLKRKLANNDYLKETLRKLKIGINLYGCDFKKMSKVMWRDEAFVTPRVLYDLYRKLILK